MSRPPRKPSRRPKPAPPDPDVVVNDGRTHIFKGPRREDHLKPPTGFPELPPPPAPVPRPRDRTPLSPLTPRPPSSALGVPPSGSPAPIPGIPRAWLRELDAYPGEEAKTPTGTIARTLLESIVAAYHPLSVQHRIDLAEIGGIFAALTEPDGRERLLALARACGLASPEDRTQLLELALVAKEMTPLDRARLIRIARALPAPEPEIDVTVET